MSEFRIDQITNQAGTAGPQVAGITTFSSTSGLLFPSGPTEYRGGRGRGLFGGGDVSAIVQNVIDYITIATTGNALDFGDLYAGRGPGGCASSTRGLFFGGYAPTNTNNIFYVTISSTGNGFDFGDMTIARTYPTGLSNSTRGIIGAGYNSNQTIDFVTISTLGNATSFGSLTTPRGGGAGGCTSPVRGIFSGGYTPSYINNIDYITIASSGNAQDFGDLTVSRASIAGCSNSIRGLFAGGKDSSSWYNTIDYITIASIGDAIDFGDLTVSRQIHQGSLSSSTRGVFGGGQVAPAGAANNTIDYVTIMSTGNAIDFGDVSVSRIQTAGCSDAHGGLGD